MGHLRVSIGSFLVTIALVGAAAVGRARAQAVELPGPAEPGQIFRQFEPPPAPRAQEAPIIAPGPRAGQPPANADAIRLMLNAVVIEGASVYAPADLAALYEAYLGTEITLLQVFDIADAITARYRQDGYVLSLAVVPAQRIAAGTVRITVIEGFVDRVLIEGDSGNRGSLVHDMAARIAEERPLTAAALERYLLLIDDLPGLTARAVLKPAATSGAADLILTVEDKPADAHASLDNRGSRFVGPLQMGLGVSANSLFGHGERTTLRTVVTSQVAELKFFDVAHVVPLTSEGTRGRVQLARSYANPGYTLKPEDVHSEATTLAFGASHPVIRSRARNLSVTGDFDLRWIEADQRDGATRISKDAIRAVRLGFEYDFIDTLAGPAVNLIALQASQGLDILGARESGSPDLSRANGRSDFTKLTMNFQRLQGLGGGFTLLGALIGQYSFSSLLAAEELAFGGGQFGRAYDPAELTGDHGLAGKLELAWGDEAEGKWLRSYQLYGFYDVGAVWNRDHDAAERVRNSAASAGIGGRATLTSDISANLELAVPLTGSVAARGEDGEDARVFFSFIGNF